MTDNIKYIGVPFRSGCNREGAQLAPSILCEKLDLDKSQWQFLHFASEIQPLSDEQYEGVKNYDTVLAMSFRLRDLVAKELSLGNRVLTIGGDHSLGLGTVAGALQNDPNLALIWFDAHGDVNTEETSPSANAHGMPVAALMGLCKTELNNVATIRLKPQNVFWVGARDLDEGEVRILQNLGVYDHVYSAEQVHSMGMKKVMSEVYAKMQKQEIGTLHLSFDIDGMDPSIVAATGTKVPNGLTEEEFEEFILQIHTIKSQINLKSMDFVEYNPLMDDEQQTTGKWCKQALHKLKENFWTC